MAHGERFTGVIRGGRVQFDHDQGKRWEAAKAHLEGKAIELSIGRLRQNRSLRANNYMWAIYRLIALETGNDEDTIHKTMKGMFLPLEELVLPNGETVKTLGSTRGLDTVAFGEFIDRIKAFAAQELGIRVPEPEELGAL